MIKSWKHQWLKAFYIDDKFTKKIPVELKRIVFRKLQMMDDADTINDLRVPPSNRLEKLKGEYKNYYSIRINDQFRLLFKWTDNHVYDVWFVDYH